MINQNKRFNRDQLNQHKISIQIQNTIKPRKLMRGFVVSDIIPEGKRLNISIYAIEKPSVIPEN
jgi:hypothetical protein